jgi:hypothetical protein
VLLVLEVLFVSDLCECVVVVVLLVFSTVGVLAESALPTIKIHVYSDGSVVVNLVYSERVEAVYLPGELLAQGVLDVGDDYYALQLELLVTSTLSCPPVYGCLYALLVVNTTTTSSNEIYEERISLVYNMWTERGDSLNITVEYLDYALNTTSLKSVVRGRVEVTASGELAQILEHAATLNKTAIEALLEQAGITWISVVDFTTTSEPSRVKYEFTIVVDELEMAEKLGLEDTAEVAEAYRSLPPSTTSIRVFYNTTSISALLSHRASGNINEHLEHAVRVYSRSYTRIESALREMYSLSGVEISLPDTHVHSLIDLLEEFTGNFIILESRGTLSARLAEGTLVVNITTPRLIKRGAKTPLDTLIALQDLATSVQSVLGVRDILNTTVYLVPESGVRVTRNGREVRRVTLRELRELKVEVASPTPTQKSLLEEIPLTHLAIAAGALVALAVLTTLTTRRRAGA